jgi:Fic/DOC family
MPLQVPAEEFSAVQRTIRRFPNGASVGELLALPEIDFTKRTLQRRLDHLVSQGRLTPKGEGRARRYLAREIYASPESDLSASMVREEPPDADPEWLSVQAKAVRKVMSRPVNQRTPVAYNGNFLDAYHPNETFYLPATLRRELRDLGQVGLNDLPAGTYLRRVMDRLLVDLSWNSSRLEGNTYSLLETERLLKFDQTPDGKSAKETQMILNHKAAIEMLSEQADEIGFNPYTICGVHALLSDNLLSDTAACGRVRSCPVGISGTVYYPLEIPQQIEERFRQILQKADLIEDPFEQAFFSMVHLPYLQPFEDVNKRVSRLAANIPMVRHNLCPLSFIDVDLSHYVSAILAVYELNDISYLRDVFVWAYRRSCARYSVVRQTLGEPDPFRLRYRTELGNLVRGVVQERLGLYLADEWIRKQVEKKIPEDDREQMRRVVRQELTSLHEGNIARYRLRPSEFKDWKEPKRT